MEFPKSATIACNSETPKIHAAVRVPCDGRERRCRCCGRDEGEELHGGEDGVKERLVWMSFVWWVADSRFDSRGGSPERPRGFVYGDMVRRWLTNYRLDPLFSLNSVPLISLLYANGRVLLHQQTRFCQILLLLRDGCLLTLFGCESFNLLVLGWWVPEVWYHVVREM